MAFNQLRFPAFLVLLLLCHCTESARFCYSGQNSRYAQKHCSSGSMDVDYVCQKYTCEGGRSSFVLRTCALKTTGCLAGSRICKFSVPFIYRDCAIETNCTLTDELCNEYNGKGKCLSCAEDFCNESGAKQHLSIVIVNGIHRRVTFHSSLVYATIFPIFIFVYFRWQ